MAGDPAAGAGAGTDYPASAGKGSRSSTRHRQFRDRAKTRVDDLQEMFSGLQSARKESRSADAAVLEEQGSQGNNTGARDPPSETLRLLQLAVAEEEDDATSKLADPRSPLPVPDSHQNVFEHQHGHNAWMPNPEQQGGGAQQLEHGVQGGCGEVSAANAMFDQMYYIDHELSIDDFLRDDDDFKISIPGSNQDDLNNLQGIGQMEHQQFNFPVDLPAHDSYAGRSNSVQDTGDVFVHMSDLLTTICPSPSQYLGPKCALWDCSRPVGGSEECQDYCNPFHAGLALNDDGLLGRPVMRPRELFDLSLLEGESLREWLFFDTPRRAFESGNRKQRSLPDYNGRGWHESRKQVMKECGGLKRSYYMDPQPSSNYEWHLFEYEINDSDALALYRLEFKSCEAKKSVKSKLASSSLNEIQQQMVRLSADSPVENKRTARSKGKASPKDSKANVYPTLNTPSQATASAPNAYQAVPQMGQMTFANENVVYGPHLPHSENIVYGPHLPHVYSTEGSSFIWNPSDRA
ncbi:hypothetical protein PR202_gb01806 [Eleusine coracana subsp. coracana]|uniref:Transcription factor VOZ1 n=1 Tax=Eleusine coracana subsp. coracana TaxID=191504 RepID=A0AAV5DXQ0_ELECO|nr:hypothetical protein PR202_gb01806 [Eleusine coracana subsp. coracana]